MQNQVITAIYVYFIIQNIILYILLNKLDTSATRYPPYITLYNYCALCVHVMNKEPCICTSTSTCRLQQDMVSSQSRMTTEQMY